MDYVKNYHKYCNSKIEYSFTIKNPNPTEVLGLSTYTSEVSNDFLKISSSTPKLKINWCFVFHFLGCLLVFTIWLFALQANGGIFEWRGSKRGGFTSYNSSPLSHSIFYQGLCQNSLLLSVNPALNAH